MNIILIVLLCLIILYLLRTTNVLIKIIIAISFIPKVIYEILKYYFRRLVIKLKICLLIIKFNKEPAIRRIKKSIFDEYCYKYKGSIKTNDSNSIYCNNDLIPINRTIFAFAIKKHKLVKKVKFNCDRWDSKLFTYKFRYTNIIYKVMFKFLDTGDRVPHMVLNFSEINGNGSIKHPHIKCYDLNKMEKFQNEIDKVKLINGQAMMSIVNYILENMEE